MGKQPTNFKRQTLLAKLRRNAGNILLVLLVIATMVVVTMAWNMPSSGKLPFKFGQG